MKRETFDDLWDKADKEYGSQGNNSFTFKHHLFAVLDDELKEQPKLSIPKKIAEELEEELKNSEDKLYTFNKCYEDMMLPDKLLLHKNYAIICAYLAGKALGVELVSIEEN